PVGLALPRLHDSVTHHLGAFAGDVPGELAKGDAWHVSEQVDTVEQRPGDAALVARHGCLRARAGPRGVAVVTARARVHRRDQEEARGERYRAAGARDRERTGLQRLTHRLECVRGELRELVQEQHAAVRERDLTGTDLRAATDEAGVRDGVVRR